jgi:hypothetical protein
MKKRLKLQAALLAALANSTYATDTCLPEDVGSKSPLLVFQCFEAKLNRQQEQIQTQQTEIQTQQTEIQALKMRLSLTEGLVAYYPFDGDANDASGYEHHGEVHGATLVKGKFGNAYSFNGKDSRIKLPASAIQGTELTVTLWVKTKDNVYALVSGANHSHNNEYLIDVVNGILQISYHNDSVHKASMSVSDNQWHSLTVVTEIAQTRIYVDGLPKKTLEYASNTPFKVEGLWLGGDQDSVNGGWQAHQQFEGLMDEIRIYNRALTDREIQSLYKQP